MGNLSYCTDRGKSSPDQIVEQLPREVLINNQKQVSNYCKQLVGALEDGVIDIDAIGRMEQIPPQGVNSPVIIAEKLIDLLQSEGIWGDDSWYLCRYRIARLACSYLYATVFRNLNRVAFYASSKNKFLASLSEIRDRIRGNMGFFPESGLLRCVEWMIQLLKTATDSQPEYEGIFNRLKSLATAYMTANPVLAVKDIIEVIDTADAWQGSRSRQSTLMILHGIQYGSQGLQEKVESLLKVLDNCYEKNLDADIFYEVYLFISLALAYGILTPQNIAQFTQRIQQNTLRQTEANEGIFITLVCLSNLHDQNLALQGKQLMEQLVNQDSGLQIMASNQQLIAHSFIDINQTIFKEKITNVFMADANQLIGHESEIRQIKESLQSSGQVALIQSPNDQTLEVVKTFASQNSNEYEIIWIIDAKGETQIVNSLCQLSKKIGIPGEVNKQHAIDVIFYINNSQNLRCLLIYARIPVNYNIDQYKPTCNSHIISISSETIPQEGDTVSVTKTGSDEAQIIFEKVAKRQIDTKFAKTINDLLDSNQEYLSQVANVQKKLNLPDQFLLDLLNQQPFKTDNLVQERMLRVINLTIERATETSKNILEICQYFKGQAIPRSLLREVCSRHQKHQIQINSDICYLQQFNLIKKAQPRYVQAKTLALEYVKQYYEQKSPELQFYTLDFINKNLAVNPDLSKLKEILMQTKCAESAVRTMNDNNQLEMQVLMIDTLNKVSIIYHRHLQESLKAEKLSRLSIDIAKRAGKQAQDTVQISFQLLSEIYESLQMNDKAQEVRVEFEKFFNQSK